VEFKLDDHYEKDYFTVEELAKQWRCTPRDIDYLINETGELRLGMKADDRLVTRLWPVRMESDVQKLVKYINQEDDRFGRARSYNSVTIDTKNCEGFYEKLPEKLCFSADETEGACCAIKLNYVYWDRLIHYPSNEVRDRKGRPMLTYISIHDLSGKRYLLMDIHETHSVTFGLLLGVEFHVIPREERDRFVREHSGGISQNKVNVHLPNMSNSSIQASRELVLKGWLAGKNIGFGAEVDLTRAQLWSELSKASPELFRSLGKDAIDDFCGLQKLCSFRRGRPKGGI